MATRIVPFMDGMKVGLGYNRLTGDRLPTPVVQGSSISSMQGAAGQGVTIDCTIIQDVSTLHKSLGISVDAGGAYMGFSGSAKVDYVNSCDFSSYSTYVVVRVSVQNAIDTIDSPIFTPDANELLINNNPDRFRQRFGDSFIAGVKKGGEYFAIYQITSSDQSERERVAGKVSAAYDSVLVSAHLNVDIQNEMASSKSHLEVHIHVFRQGTIGSADLNLEDIMKTAKEFPIGVSGDKAFPYAVLLQDYDGLKNPNDKFEYLQIQAKQDVLEDFAKKRFDFLALRDDLKYILKHGDDFKNADGTSVVRQKLIKDFDEVVDAINTMQNKASICARDPGECEFTKFDVTKFVVPILKRASQCFNQPNYPLGEWEIRVFDATPADYAKFIHFTTPLSGIWGPPDGSAVFEISAIPSPGASVTLKLHSGPTYLSTYRLRVLADGCSMEGTFSDNEEHRGGVSFTWIAGQP